MAKLIYSAFTSHDGYLADETGNFVWVALDEEVHAFINNREKHVSTYLFGRKMYETMAVWEAPDVIPHQTVAASEYASIWQAAEKAVFSTTLQSVSAAQTRLEGKFEADVVRELKTGATREVAMTVRRSPRMPFEPAWSTNITY